jgi:hypothetical protein
MPIDDERLASESPQGIPPITGHHAPLDGSPARVIACDVSGLASARRLGGGGRQTRGRTGEFASPPGSESVNPPGETLGINLEVDARCR